MLTAFFIMLACVALGYFLAGRDNQDPPIHDRPAKYVVGDEVYLLGTEHKYTVAKVNADPYSWYYYRLRPVGDAQPFAACFPSTRFRRSERDQREPNR